MAPGVGWVLRSESGGAGLMGGMMSGGGFSSTLAFFKAEGARMMRADWKVDEVC